MLSSLQIYFRVDRYIFICFKIFFSQAVGNIKKQSIQPKKSGMIT